jgi:hypothetical protein
MPRSLALLAALALALAPQIAAAKVYKVGPGEPIKAPTTKLLSRLKPGDVVEIAGGQTYGPFAIKAKGKKGKPITVRGVKVDGKRPIIASKGGFTVHVDRGEHIVVEGLEITGGDYCFRHHGAWVVLRDTVIHHCKNGLLGTDYESGSLTMEYCEVHSCGYGDQHHQIYMSTNGKQFPKSVFRMQYCYVHDAVGGNNVKSRAERNEIYYNWIEGAKFHELELIGPDVDPWDPRGKQLPREDSDVVGNVLRSTKKTAWAAIRVGGDGTGGTAGRYRFVNNTIIVPKTMSGPVFRHFMMLESIEMHANVLFAQGGRVRVALQQGFDQQGDEKKADKYMWSTGKQQIAGSNNWISAGMRDVPKQWKNTKSGKDPGFRDLAAHDLTPKDGSPLLDGGQPKTFSPAGYPFPGGQALPTSLPPRRTLLAPGSAKARPKHGKVIDIGAYEGQGTPGKGDKVDPAATASSGSSDGGGGFRLAGFRLRKRHLAIAGAGGLALIVLLVLLIARRKKGR